MKRLFTMVNAVLISMALRAAQPSVIPISTAEELYDLAQKSQTDNYAGTQIRLEADIDLSTVNADWMPIGSAERPFSGDFNGNNHVVYNLYMLSSSFTSGVGLFAETAETAVVHHLGLAQGQIMTDGASNIAAFIGINRGKLHHCFNMLQIIAHNGNNVGGLVGRNAGEIAYCYNAGIITDGNSNIGGLVGYNEASARLNECYNMGYCKGSDHVGALFGKNEAPESQLTKVVFDQQLTRIYATGDGGNDAILKDNTKYAIEKSSVFTEKYSPFYENPEKEWHYESAGTWSHPQLLCFKDHPASHVSVKAIWLDAEERPIERAEGVGTPKEGNSPRQSFTLETTTHATYGKGEWYSPSPDVITIANPTGTKADVHRPCGNQEVILTLTYDRFVKQIYTIVKGYDAFDAGIVEGYVFACWNEEGVGFKKHNEGKEASGGKDDEQKNEELSYHYRIIRDTVIRSGESDISFESIDTFYFAQETYAKWNLPTSVPGEYAFRREVRDAQCKTEWTVSHGANGLAVGRLYLRVFDSFDPGSLFEKPDTIYAVLPQTLTIASEQDATGGGGVFRYLWRLERSEWDETKQEWLPPVTDDIKNPLYIDGEPVNTASFDYTFTKEGKYVFSRKASDETCDTKPLDSRNQYMVYVSEPVDVCGQYGGGRAKRNVRLTCCSDELPYEYVYTYADGHTDTIAFSQNGQWFAVEDTTREGCPLDVTLRIEVLQPIGVEVEPIPPVCQSSSHMTIVCHALSGNPKRFDLMFGQGAKEAGFRDSIGQIFPSSGIIEVPFPPFVPIGEQTLTLVFYSDEDVAPACQTTEPQTLTFRIDLDGYVRRKGEDILFVDNSGRHTHDGLTFVAYRWFRDGEPLSDETDQFLYEYPSLNGIYHVEMTTEDGTTYCSCRYEMRPTMGVEQQPAETPYRKLLKDGQIVLVVGEKSYTVLGQFIR